MTTEPTRLRQEFRTRTTSKAGSKESGTRMEFQRKEDILATVNKWLDTPGRKLTLTRSVLRRQSDEAMTEHSVISIAVEEIVDTFTLEK